MERRSEVASKVSINISAPASAKDSIESKDNKDNLLAPPSGNLDDSLNSDRSERSNSALKRKDRPVSKRKRKASARGAPPTLSN